uniref:ArnT family glycosyltransferase n=1 Tax=Desertifilum tharense IPPAS B-1220 TaxID=1781255 RepID=A0ACD5GRK1_9CYAN
MVSEDRSRPPAYRILVLPFSLLFGTSTTLLRVCAWGFWGATLGFVYLAGRAIAEPIAGAFAALFLLVCPIAIGTNMRFYVDYPLYLAIAATFYFLFRDWNRETPSRYNWIGLGIALGLGGLAKPTIIFTIVPVLFLALVLSWRRMITTPTPKSLIQASVLGFVLMLPWWVFNWKPAIAKAFLSGGSCVILSPQKAFLIKRSDCCMSSVRRCSARIDPISDWDCRHVFSLTATPEISDRDRAANSDRSVFDGFATSPVDGSS